MREHQLIYSFSLLAKFFRIFSALLLLLVDEYTEILFQFWEIGVDTLLSFEKLGELSIGFWIALRAYKYTFQKRGKACSHFLKTQMKFKSYLRTLHKNSKRE